uniref:WD repeat domain 17 n=1 Tax=Cyprinus carpio carpio TaxID=630221 RepID=A0A8C1DIN6_CYPCA
MSVFATPHLWFFYFYLIAETNGHVTDLKWCYWHLFIQVKMSQVKQVGLLAAGCQPWNKDVCAASGDRFAYCATLAIYVYQLDHRYNEFKLRAIMSEHKKTITAISWCPHNPEVFASASADNLLIIWNVAEQKAVTRLDNTKDSQVGVLRIWNVSRVTPLDNFKLKKTGFHALHVLNSPPAKKSFSTNSPSKNHYTSSTSEAVPPPTLSQNQAFSLPPGHAVCCFMDGGVGLYDMGTKKWDFLRDLGHVETIFDCKFKPDDPNLLATASFDGTIKVWDINTLTAVYTSPGNEGVVYSLSWAPGDLNCIAGATSRNGAFIWDVKKGKMITRFNEHGKNGIFCVAWSHKDSKRIATCSGDGFCIIRTLDGKVLHKYKHPAAVFGCDWSQNNKDMIATGCEDKNVRVYYLATSSDQPLKVFTGHTAKVFHVRWSPLREGILCSGSDDGTVRIWDYTQDACINVLSGHTAPVRGLMWNTEVPYLLTSGSWDYTIRVWDTRDGTCLDTVYDHGADVYGLTCHPSRPFTMASCSRDSTVRLWSLTPLIAPLVVNILTDHSWDDIIGNTDRAMVPGAPPLLCGKISKDIKQELDKLSSDMHMKKLRWFSECFSPPGGSHNLWDLVAVINGQDDSLLPQNYGQGIMHMKHLVRFKTSEAQELTIVKMSKFGGGIGAPSKEERLKNAAEIHIRLGQIQRYCELMVELGEWEKALSVAPGVSMKYWKKLMQRRADQLMQEGNDDVIPYCIATGEVKKLVNFFTSRGQLKEAVLVAQGACEGNIHGPQITSINHAANSDNDNIEKYCGMLHRVCKELAEWYFQDGRAVLAACCHLAVDNAELAMASLIRGNELELAVCVGTVLGESASKATHYVLELLARKYMTTATWNLAARLLQMIPDNEILLAKLCAFYPGSSAEINDLHEKCGLPTLEECKELAESAHAGGEIFPAVKYYLLSPEPEKALPIGITYVKEQLSSPDWTVDSVYHILDLLSYIRTDRLILPKCSEERNELLILCGYIGALLAIGRQYSSIVPALYEYTSQLLKRREVAVPLQIEQLSVELEAWRACTVADNALYNPPSEAQKREYSQLLSRMSEEPIKGLEGPDYVTGSNLPSHSDVQISCFTGLRIQGPAFFLEDGKSAISLNDALMWAKVNPFSPLGTGIRLNPF